MASLRALDLATPIPNPQLGTLIHETSTVNTLDLLLKLSIQQTQLIKRQNANVFKRLEQMQHQSNEKLDFLTSNVMSFQRLKRKLHRIKCLIKDTEDSSTISSKLEQFGDCLRDMKSEVEVNVELETIKRQIRALDNKLSEIADHAQIAAQYADYRQSLEDAKADFLVRQNTQ